MTLPVTVEKSVDDVTLVKLAREIAVDLRPVEDVLNHYQIGPDLWQKLQQQPRFQAILTSQIEEWNSAINTHERTKLKAAALIEFWLEEANGRLHSDKELLTPKVQLAKLLASIAGMGMQTYGTNDGAAPERFSININLGADAKLKFEKDVTTKVIDAEVTGEP